MSRKPPPFSYEAEMIVLSAMMQKGECIDIARGELVTSDFYNEKHCLIFDALIEMHDKDERINILSLEENLKKRVKSDVVPSRVQLAKILKESSTTQDLKQHILILLEKSLRRQVLEASRTALQKSYEEQSEIFDTIGELSYNAELIQSKIKSENLQLDNEKSINDAYEFGKGIITGKIQLLDTPLHDLNRKMMFLPGELLVVGGRPSMGKTALGLTFAEYWSMKHKTAFISLEMTDLALTLRRMSFYTGYSNRELLKDDDKLREARSKLIDMETNNLIIDDRSDYHYNNLKGRIKQLVKKYGVKVVIADYLQLFPSQGNSKREEVGNISNLLKAIAKELNIYMVCLAQLSRESAKGGKTHSSYFPKMDHLKEAGEIEQDADHILLVHRPEYYLPNKDINLANRQEPVANLGMLFYSKQRNGPTGIIPMTYEKPRMKFTNFLSCHDEKVYDEIRKEQRRDYMHKQEQGESIF
jgi:replicative DNA helicase